MKGRPHMREGSAGPQGEGSGRGDRARPVGARMVQRVGPHSLPIKIRLKRIQTSNGIPRINNPKQYKKTNKEPRPPVRSTRDRAAMDDVTIPRENKPIPVEASRRTNQTQSRN